MTRSLRDSGVGWLGAVPQSWPILPARALFGERKRRSNSADVHLTPSQKYGVLPQAEYMEITGNKVVLNLSGSDNMRHVEAGDFVSHLRSFQGGLEFASMPGKVSAAYTVLKPKLILDSRYFKYLFKSDLYIQALQTTTDQLRDGQSIRFGQFALIPLPYPGLEEQRAIADYLDRETTQIDAFIAKNEELIALLTERRNSVWSVLFREAASIATLAPLRRFVSSITDGPFGSSLTSAHYSDAGTRVIRLGNVGINEFKAGDEAFISDDYAATLTAHAALPGDVIVAGLGDDRMPLGRACVLPDVGPAIVKADCYRVRPTHSVSPAFLAWVLSAPPTRGLMKLAARGSTRERLNTSVVLDIEVPIPEADVQNDLVERFATSASIIDEARSVAERGVSLARERRAALISAAVTGKIDVGVAG